VALDDVLSRTYTVSFDHAGQRLDIFLANIQFEISRSRLSFLAHEGNITVNGKVRKPSFHVSVNDVVVVTLSPAKEISLQPQPISLDILFEDSDIIVINKPSGLVVHPAPGHESNTLVNALLYHCPGLLKIGGEIRPGIVHRLDQDTSGVLVVAKNDLAHVALSKQFKERQPQKVYLAFVSGVLKEKEGEIDFSIGRHPSERKKMSIHGTAPRSARSQYFVLQQFEHTALLKVIIETGRTHQIRVHLSAIGHPIIGDSIYGGRSIYKTYRTVSRQMLHAIQLQFIHPIKKEPCFFTAPIPSDFKKAVLMYGALDVPWETLLT